jgi:predicted RNA binding protein YcfA (HicA-like mRNA interferase family)
VSKLPIVDARTMHRLLLHLGFVQVRQRGSHVFYRHPDGRTTTVPHHAGRDLARPLLRAILQEIDIGPEDFRQALKRRGR